jgi:predicted SAM-dependent methyltransferase
MNSNKMNTQTKIRYKKMRGFLGNLQNKEVLDVGAGYHPISKGLKTKKTICLDGVKDYHPDICCNIDKGIPLKNNSVDVIIAGEFLEHIFNPFKLLREFSRVLRSKGEVVVSTPNICSIKSRLKVLFGKLPESCASPEDDDNYQRHINDFNLKQLEKIFNECGFQIVERDSNGIISHSKLFWPLFLTPTTFGETLIIKAVKK